MKLRNDQRGAGLITTILLLTLLAAFLAAVGLLLSQERSRVRDAHRIVDMIRVQYAFETLYREKATYKDAASGCGAKGALVSSCALALYLPGIVQLKDPGSNDYKISQVPDDTDYGVSFSLERGYEDLAKGKHVLSKDGIR